MAKGRTPTEHDAAEAMRIVLGGLAAGRGVHELAKSLVELHPAHNTFPGEVLLGLAADVLEVAGV